MAVGVEDQLPAVRVALPLRDHLLVTSIEPASEFLDDLKA